MNAALAVFASAFDAAADAGTPRAVWWRDDDAVAATPSLAALGRTAAGAGASLAVAAIPEGMEPSLGAWCDGEGAVLLQHGVAHRNHEADGKPAELGTARDAATIVAELVAARAALDGSPAFIPVMVPPWNRMRPDLPPALAAAGYRGVSLWGADSAAGPPRRVDTHVDPVAWRGDRSLLPPDALAGMARAAVATAGPIGLLTHHLVHDEAIAAFVAAFAALVRDHPGARWVSPREIFA